MKLSLFQFVLEMTFCLSVYLGVYSILKTRKNSTSSLFTFLYLSPLFSIISPLISFQLSSHLPFLTTEFIVSKSSVSSLSVTYSGNIILTLGDIFSMLYFLGFAYYCFMFLDKLFAIQFLNNKQSLSPFRFFTHFSSLNNKESQVFLSSTSFMKRAPTYLIHLYKIINWFNPVIYIYTLQLKSLCRQLKEEGASAVQETSKRTTPVNKNILSSFFALSLVLVSFLSYNPYHSLIERIDTSLNEISSIVFFDLYKTQKGTILDWGKISLPIVKINKDISLPNELSVRIINRPFFKEIKNAELNFYKEGVKQRIIKLEAIFNSPNLEEPLYASGREEFKKYVNAISSKREVSIFLKLETEKGEIWTSALAITRYQKLYDKHPDIQKLIAEKTPIDYTLNTQETSYFLTEKASLDTEVKDAIYTLKWGDIKIILEKHAHPNIYIGELNIDLENIESKISNKIEVLKDGKTQSFTNFEFQRYDSTPEKENGYTPFKYSTNDPVYSIVLDSIFLQNWSEGTRFSITMETPDIKIYSATVSIIDPYEPYYSNKVAKKIEIEEPEYTFQIINLPNKKTTLKVDTTLSENQKYIDMYKNPESYSIVHVPEFRTNRRALSSDDFIWIEEEEEKIQGFLDFVKLPEYIHHIGQSIGLTWGKNLANPGSVLYNRKDIIENNHAPLKIRLEDRELELEQFEIIVQHLEEQPTIHKIQRKNGEFRLPDFSEVDTETSIFFQKIIVFEEGKFYFFPVNFAFYIGKERSDYSLTIEETSLNEERFDTLINKKGHFEFSWKNSTLEDIFSDIFQTNKLKIRLLGAAKNPPLNVHYKSEKINTRLGQQLFLNELRKKYRFSFSSNFEVLPSYRLGLRYENRLKNFIVSEEKRKKASSKSCSNGQFEILESATMEDLKHFIQDTFGEYVYLASSNEDAYYFSLDISSIDALILQLETEYGIQLVKGEYPVRFIDVQFVR